MCIFSSVNTKRRRHVHVRCTSTSEVCSSTTHVWASMFSVFTHFCNSDSVTFIFICICHQNIWDVVVIMRWYELCLVLDLTDKAWHTDTASFILSNHISTKMQEVYISSPRYIHNYDHTMSTIVTCLHLPMSLYSMYITFTLCTTLYTLHWFKLRKCT